MDLKLKGKRALVTGASRGLGYAVANTLAHEGANIALNSRTMDNLSAAAKTLAGQTDNQVQTVPGDVTDPAVPAQLITQTVELMGGLDLLVTNTGGPPSGKFESFDDATWQKAIDLSLMSHVRLIRAALPALLPC